MLKELFQIIENRKNHPTSESYTAKLMAMGEDQILKKVGEEAMEVILAAKGQGDARLIEEVADLYYHLCVLLSFRNLNLDQIETELGKRHKK